MQACDLSAGKHDFPAKIKEFGLDPRHLHEGVRNMRDWVKHLREFSETCSRRGHHREKIEGDAFEHLVQSVIEYRAHDAEKVNCVDIGATAENDGGIDLIGRTHDGKPHAHQCKFTAAFNRRLSMTHSRIERFPAACHKYGSGISMTLWTTAKGVSYQAQGTFGLPYEVFGIDKLREFLDGAEDFWNDHYAQSLGKTPKPRIGRIDGRHTEQVISRDYQDAALSRFKAEIMKSSTLKGRYVYPTGSGKTLIESLILNHQIERTDDASVHIIVAPRIVLVNQLMNSYRDYIGDKYVAIGFHSGDKEDGPNDTWMRQRNRNTTDLEEVELEILRAQKLRKHIVIFSTYHSLHKLARSSILFKTLIADESQYCISKNYFNEIQTISAQVKLFFTATERHGVGERSNDNEEVFGEVLGYETIKNLVKQGILVEPRLHLMRGKRVKKDLDSLVAEVRYIARKQRTMVHSRLPSKTLFACKTANDIRTIVENIYDLMESVPNHKIFTIISDTNLKAMVNGKIIEDRSEFLKQLDEHNGDAMIFHYDILSEGIDVDGITGVAILRNLKRAKLLQTIGRCIRPYKADPSLKPYSYVSVPVIDNDIRNSEDLENIIREMLSGGLEVNVEHIEVTDIDNRTTYPEKTYNFNGSIGSDEQEELEIVGGSLAQTDLSEIRHEVKVIRRDFMEILEKVERDLKEQHRRDMWRREVTDDLIDDIFGGEYSSKKFDQDGYSSTSQHGHLSKHRTISDVLTSCEGRHRVVERAWGTGRMRESSAVKTGMATRPISPSWIIEDHVERLGHVKNKSVLTFNIEYVPYLKARGANVVLTTRDYCESTKTLSESQLLETEYLSMEAIMSTPPPSI